MGSLPTSRLRTHSDGKGFHRLLPVSGENSGNSLRGTRTIFRQSQVFFFVRDTPVCVGPGSASVTSLRSPRDFVPVCVGRDTPVCVLDRVWPPNCHVQLNAPVQKLEDVVQRHMNSPVMNVAFPLRYTPRLQPLTFKAALSGSGTMCGMVYGLSNAVGWSTRITSTSC